MSALAVQETHIKGHGTMKHQMPVKHTYFIILAVKVIQKTELASSYHPMQMQNLTPYAKESVK